MFMKYIGHMCIFSASNIIFHLKGVKAYNDMPQSTNHNYTHTHTYAHFAEKRQNDGDLFIKIEPSLLK